ncbi:MAG: hypothetical protein Q4D06_02360 [Coriobacteriia bacterium]|nr:hypothetical protein [Coriobacteriia bacterium]
MGETDARLSSGERSVLASVIGSYLDSYAYDGNEPGRPAYGVVWLRFGEKVVCLLNQARPLEYLGELDDVAVCSVRMLADGDVGRFCDEWKRMEQPLCGTVRDVLLVEDTLLQDEGGECFEFTSTVAVVFVLDNEEVSFYFGSWLSELILVDRGTGVLNRIAPACAVVPPDDRDYIESKRNIVSLRGYA